MSDLIQFFRRVVDLLHELHDKGFVHNDVKINNIMVDKR